MSDATSGAEEGARHDLGRLTGAECRVLYWLCKGLDPVQIAERMTCSESAVRSQLTGIYAKFELQKLPARNRFYLLDRVYCPLHEKLVKDPERDCRRTRKPRTKSPETSGQGARQGDAEAPPSTGDEGADAGEESIEEPTTPADPRILALVKQDEELGIIPLNRSIIVRPDYPWVLIPKEKPKQPWLTYLLLVLVGVLIGAVLLYAIMSGRPVPPPGPGPATSTPQSNPQQQPSSGARPSATAVPAALSNVQLPNPGSVIAAGQPFTRGGVTVTARRQLYISGLFIGVSFDVQNGSSDQIVVRWKPSFLHLEDDRGRVYHQRYEDSAYFNQVYQFSVAPGASQTISASPQGYFDTSYAIWEGQIDPKVKYLIFRVDDFAGLSNLSWRFDM